MRRANFKYPLLALAIVVLAATLAAGAKSFTFISKNQLRQELNKAGVIVIDVRTDGDWNSSQWKIKGAQRQSPTDVQDWMGQYSKDQPIVLYCA